MKLANALKAQGFWNQEHNLPIWGGNPHVILATYLKLASLQGELDSDTFGVAMAFVLSCRRSPGLFYRWPRQPEPRTSHDELIGILSFATLLQPQILSRLRWRLWCYDTKYSWLPNLRYCLARFFMFTSFAFLPKKPWPWDERLWPWSIKRIAANPDLTDVSSRILVWLQADRVYESGTQRMKDALDEFFAKSAELFPGGVSEWMAIYYKSPEHPFAVHAPKTFPKKGNQP